MALTEGSAAPGRNKAFRIDARLTPGYRFCRGVVRVVVRLWWRPRVYGRAFVPETGPVILAPVHRSFADFVFTAVTTERKLFFMAKDSLWKSRFLGWLLLTLGAFPVHRESADREALARAEEVLRQGGLLVLFPEGARQEGTEVQPLLEGAAFLAARTGARIVPVGIGNSDRSMPKGTRIPKPLTVTLVLGEPLDPPERSGAGRVSRSKVHATTEELRRRIQRVYDLARG
jgi:1-acyl-sn-glycerol-3-phosphate acyltransferase